MTRFEFLFVAVISLLFSFGYPAASQPAVKAAYYPSWAAASISPSDIDTSFFTHVYYAFLIPNDKTNKLETPDSGTANRLSDFTATLRRKNPPVKTLLSIGGGSQTAKNFFPQMVTRAESRKIFINSAIDVARKLGFDGMDLDWEDPQSDTEMQYLSSLIQEWRQVIDAEAKSSSRAPLLLTAAFQCSVEISWPVRRSYPVQSLNLNLDWINAMCYDFHGMWENFTGAHSALTDPNSKLSTSYGLNSWIQAGMNSKKLVMGLPLYGRTWTLANPNVNKIGSPAVGPGPTSDPTDNVLTYDEVVQFNEANNATVVYDEATKSTYSYTRRVWIGYDDARSAVAKVRYAQSLGLRGYFLWALGYDKGWVIARAASGAFGG